jgi:hypothetical protein
VWVGRAQRELEYATYWASRANPINGAGALAKVVLQGAHAKLANRGAWALNEKRMVEWAALTDLYDRLARVGASADELTAAISDVASAIAVITAEI